MISVIIPSYRNPKCLDICLESVLKTQSNDNEIIVVLDGYIEESSHIVKKYENKIHFLPLSQNMGMQYALNIGAYNASNEWILIVNDDNVFPTKWDEILSQDKTDKVVISPNQIEKSPSIFDFITRDFGDIDNFKLDEYLGDELKFRKEILVENGEIFPFFMQKNIIWLWEDLILGILLHLYVIGIFS